jgi:hypothetical protein
MKESRSAQVEDVAKKEGSGVPRSIEARFGGAGEKTK